MEELTVQAELACPYCGELVVLVIEADLSGELVQDCEVCCNPWTLSIRRDAGEPRIEARRLED